MLLILLQFHCVAVPIGVLIAAVLNILHPRLVTIEDLDRDDNNVVDFPAADADDRANKRAA